MVASLIDGNQGISWYRLRTAGPLMVRRGFSVGKCRVPPTAVLLRGPSQAFAMHAETGLVWTVSRAIWGNSQCAVRGASRKPPPGKRFCGDCGSVLENRCPQCGADNLTGKRFCADCGAAFTAVRASAQLSSPAQPPAELHAATAIGDAATPTEGERRHLTVLFSDLVNSTEIAGHSARWARTHRGGLSRALCTSRPQADSDSRHSFAHLSKASRPEVRRTKNGIRVSVRQSRTGTRP